MSRKVSQSVFQKYSCEEKSKVKGEEGFIPLVESTSSRWWRFFSFSHTQAKCFDTHKLISFPGISYLHGLYFLAPQSFFIFRRFETSVQPGMFPVLYLPSSAFSSLTAPVCGRASAAFVMRSSECLSFPNSSLHTDWLPVSPRYHSKHKTAWHGARLSASQRMEHAAVVFRGRPTHGSDLL